MTSSCLITCASCNLRYDEPKDKHPWQERKHIMAEFFLQQKPGVIATQEGRRPQLYELFELIQKEYNLADQHRDYRDGRMYPALFVHKDWDIQHSTDRWLSETPTLMGSTSFGSRWPKLGVFAEIRHKQQGQTVHVCSFHLDNVSAAARPQQAKVLLAQLDLIYPHSAHAFLMGDANDSPKTETIQTFLKAGFKNPFEAQGTLTTYHDFGRPEHAAHIDYVFSRSETAVSKETYVDDRTENFYSDHYYLSATFALR